MGAWEALSTDVDVGYPLVGEGHPNVGFDGVLGLAELDAVLGGVLAVRETVALLALVVDLVVDAVDLVRFQGNPVGDILGDDVRLLPSSSTNRQQPSVGVDATSA